MQQLAITTLKTTTIMTTTMTTMLMTMTVTAATATTIANISRSSNCGIGSHDPLQPYIISIFSYYWCVESS
jgi:hypothetical protein